MKNIFSIATLAAFCVCILSSCGGKQAPPITYKTVDVQNGGSITGIVHFLGTKPPANPVIVEKDQDICGTSHPNPADPGNGTGIANAIVYIEKIASGKPFDSSMFIGKLDQNHCEFLPHVQFIKLGQKLVVSNSDDVTHNSHFFMDGRPIDNHAQPSGAPPVEIMLPEAGLHNVNCDVHPWMRGFIMVVDHPYYTMTDTSGRFTLTNVPPGTYTIKVWRDSWVLNQPKGPNGKITSYDWEGDFHNDTKVEVKPNAASTLDISLH